MIKEEDRHSPVPALDQGLDILELLTRSDDGIGFQEILDKVRVSRATAARIIRVLKERGYLIREEGRDGYFPGPKLNWSATHLRFLDALRTFAEPILERVSDTVGRMTVLLFVRNSQGMLVVAKVQPEGGEAMLPVGRVMPDFGRNPWGWIFYSVMDRKAQLREEERMENPERFRSRLSERMRFFNKNGFTFDDCEVHPHRRRLAAPVRGQSGLHAVLGLGANRLDLPDDCVQKTGAALLRGAGDIVELLEP